MLVPVRACVVASSTTEPVPLNVSVTRMKGEPPPLEMVVCPVYWMVVAPFTDHTTRSVPLGSVTPLLFIFSPIGVVPGGTLLFLMPMYRLENAPAVPVHV